MFSSIFNGEITVYSAVENSVLRLREELCSAEEGPSACSGQMVKSLVSQLIVWCV